MTVQEFFEALPSKVDPAKTAGMNNRFAFDIADVGVWTVSSPTVPSRSRRATTTPTARSPRARRR